jgi:hypothetical protein
VTPLRTFSRKSACCLVAVVAPLFVACGGGGGNVNAPRGNAIGDRYPDFMRVVAHAKTLPTGMHYASTLPPELQIKNLLAVYVDARGAYALEFPSIPIDSNPIYVFVEEGAPDPEGVVRAMCSEHGAWHFARKLDEPGWYYVYGP